MGGSDPFAARHDKPFLESQQFFSYHSRRVISLGMLGALAVRRIPRIRASTITLLSLALKKVIAKEHPTASAWSSARIIEVRRNPSSATRPSVPNHAGMGHPIAIPRTGDFYVPSRTKRGE